MSEYERLTPKQKAALNWWRNRVFNYLHKEAARFQREHADMKLTFQFTADAEPQPLFPQQPNYK